MMHTCSIVGCTKPVTRGGRMKPKPICSMHYHRERRGSPAALEAGPAVRADVKRIHVTLSLACLKKLDKLARLSNESRGEIIERGLTYL